MFPVLRALLPLFNVAALVLVARRRRLLRTLRAVNADAPDRAIPLEESGLSGWWLKRLTAAGVFKRTPSGLYWLDNSVYSSYRRARIIRVAVVLGLAFGAWFVWTQTLCC
jgi:hypothetical protein